MPKIKLTKKEKQICKDAGFYYLVSDESFKDNIKIPIVKDLDKKIWQKIKNKPRSLNMGGWHMCKTTHCRGGWAIHLAGKKGYDLESEIGVDAAAALIYLKSTGYIPDFFTTDKEAKDDIRKQAKKANK